MMTNMETAMRCKFRTTPELVFLKRNPSVPVPNISRGNSNKFGFKSKELFILNNALSNSLTITVLS